jgi:tyrosyl-tRNA synthetase
MSTIKEYKQKAKQGTVNPKDLKSALAKSMVKDFWGREESEKAAREFDWVFKQNKTPSDMECIRVSSDKIKLVDLLTHENILSSRGQAKRMIRQGAVYLDSQRITDIGFIFDLTKKDEAVLKVGKKRFYKLEKI